MKLSMFSVPLALLTATSCADEFPNPCKRSDMASSAVTPIRAVGYGGSRQVGSMFAALLGKVCRKRHVTGEPCKEYEMCYCELPAPLEDECGPVLNGYNGYGTEQWEHNCENYKEYMRCVEKTKDYCSPDRPPNWGEQCTWYPFWPRPC